MHSSKPCEERASYSACAINIIYALIALLRDIAQKALKEFSFCWDDLRLKGKQKALPQFRGIRILNSNFLIQTQWDARVPKSKTFVVPRSWFLMRQNFHPYKWALFWVVALVTGAESFHFRHLFSLCGEEAKYNLDTWEPSFRKLYRDWIYRSCVILLFLCFSTFRDKRNRSPKAILMLPQL